jgi:hypothetical protein
VTCEGFPSTKSKCRCAVKTSKLQFIFVQRHLKITTVALEILSSQWEKVRRVVKCISREASFTGCYLLTKLSIKMTVSTFCSHLQISCVEILKTVLRAKLKITMKLSLKNCECLKTYQTVVSFLSPHNFYNARANL